jgi:hypothetical protein
MRSVTSRAFRGDTRWNFALAFAGLKLGQNCFPQTAFGRAAPEIANHNRGRDCDGDDDERDADSQEVGWLNRLSLGKR